MVTSRATEDDLIEDQDSPSADITDNTVTSDIMAPPRRPARKPVPAKPSPAKPGDAVSEGKAGGGVSVNGASATGKQDANAGASPSAAKETAARGTARPEPVDATMVDGIPALPADTVSSARGGKPAAADSPIDYPAEAAVRPAAPAPAPASAADTTSAPGSSGTTSAGARSSDSGSSAPAPDGRRPEGVSAETSSVPPAAFAWEMPDPPPHSPSSPARAFLRSGLTAKTPAPAKPGSPATSTASSTSTMSPPAKPATGEPRPRGPVTLGPPRGGPDKGGSAAKGQQKAKKEQSKRSARQAHLTIARVEPWSVMKFSFVVSLVAFVILFVAVSVLYGALSALGVFDSIQHLVNSVTSSQSSTGVNAKAWFSASRILGYTALLGSLNIVLITAMSTIGSVVYNLTSRLVGGVEVTLRETE
jgi:Transmembrane domain of unknown function (DUF3566)